jgi:D-lactate dehydrogenase
MMDVAVYSSRDYDRRHLMAANAGRHRLHFIEQALHCGNAGLAAGCKAVCLFVNDAADEAVLARLAELGISLLALRCAGTDHVDFNAAQRHGIEVVNVAGYSPHSVAEHAAMLLMALERKLPQAHQRTQRFDFSLEGLQGRNLQGKQIGIIGTGRIGCVFARIMRGFDAELLGHDIVSNPDFLAAGGRYVTLPEMCRAADVLSLHCALNAATRHLVDAPFLDACKPGLLLVNTSRGGVVDSQAALAALQSGRLGGFALDVYEHEAGLFFNDHSGDAVQDPLLAALMALPNVIVTGHQGFLTEEALADIARTTLESLDDFAGGRPLRHRVGM